MGAWGRDFRLAIRTLARRPGFTLTVLATLALGIGATTALFGVFHTVFLDPIPLPHSSRLVVVMETFGADHHCCGPASGPDYLSWRRRSRAFSGMAAESPAAFTLTGVSQPELVQGTYVTASAFALLGVQPLLGRALVASDQDHPGAVVLSWEFWRNRLGGSRSVLNSSIHLDGKAYTIVGIMPKGFDVPSPWAQMGTYKLYLPFQDQVLRKDRGNHSYPVIARLAPGVTPALAQSDMDRVMRELAKEYPETNGARTAKVFTVHQYLFGSVGRELGMILGAGVLVLLIACGNVAGLLLARSAGRETELAVRAALGAGRRAIARMLFSESLLLAAVGGAVGVGLSFLGVDALKALLPPTIPRIADVRIDGAALLFALGATVFTALAFGVLPALLASRGDLAESVKEGGYGTPAPAKERLRSAFIVGQIALGLVLANGAVLLVRSYAALRGQSYGFDARHVLTMALNPAGPRYDNDQAYESFYGQVLAKVRTLHGVESAGTVSRLPLFGGSNGNVWVEGTPPRTSSDQGPLVEFASVAGDYFKTMRIPLLEGRLLLPEDSASAATGVVINEALAKEAWPGRNPLGKRFSYSDNPPDWLTVVGVVANVREWGPETPPLGEAYAPLARGWTTSQYLVVRTAGDPAALAPEVRRAILAVDPSQPPSDVRTMSERVDRTFAQRRFYTTLIGLFALAALLLAAAGVYGTVSYFVTRSVRELGVRAALGARGSSLVGLVLGRGARLAAWGVLFGLAGVWASTRVVGGLVYGVKAVDVPTLASGCALLALVVLAASALPAARALRISPMLMLRSE